MSDSPSLECSVVTEEPGELLSVTKKSRRQTAIYPNTLRAAPKPFSRSAAKRESVMALGSIEHLQHYFTKTGIAAKQRPSVRTKGLVPAIGGRNGHIRASSSVTSIPELPPSPMVPNPSILLPFVPKAYEADPAQLKPGVIRDLKAVERAWQIDSNDQLAPNPDTGFDVLATLRVTTHAIRSVRDYVVSLPDDHITSVGKGLGPYRSSAFSAPGTRKDPVQVNSTMPSLASVIQTSTGNGQLPTLRTVSGGSTGSSSPVPPSSPAKPRASLVAQHTGTSVQNMGQSTQPFPSRPEDPLALVRRAALDVLTALRGLEERSRVEPDPSAAPQTQSRLSTRASHEALSASSRSATPADRVGSPGMFHSGDEADRDSATSFPASTLGTSSAPVLPRLQIPGGGGASTETVLVHGRGAVQVWSDSDEEDFLADEPEKREVWDEKLVLGGGWLYRSDLGDQDVAAERAAVGRYLDVVDAVLFRGRRGVGKRGWDRERRKGRKSELASGHETPANSSVMSDSEDEPMGSRRISGALSEAMKYLSVAEDDTLVEVDEEGEEADEEGLPDWATVEPFGSDLIGEGIFRWCGSELTCAARTSALLRYLLPPHLIPHLPESPNRETLLTTLSDGQMLCVAYNAGVRKSRKQWGFINAQSIHDTTTATLEEKAAGSWTFRRRENLGLWAAALKLRYVIDIVPAEPKSTHPTRHFHEAPKPEAEAGGYAPNQFSPIVVAKHESGWEDMLERAIWQWVNAVVTERKQDGQE
ncbi:hypothetical protein CTheo_6129 [Ceratobasidium theobromae]|uniref:Uncharacterized protein n=1 Tax=Ceratobasidium theobromae TaxID=1582974 RepID=A0A5N5QGL9_9AGAM|nr:hypothetical protein CTheo_6129 [Ceratobasidium theobromae]